MNPVLRIVLQVLGIGVLVAGGLAVALAVLVATVLLGPLLFWLAWNVLDFASAVGLPELGFWGIVLATMFLVVGWAGKVLITAIVFVADPSWFHGTAQVRWPEPTFRNFIAVAVLALLASRPHSHAHKRMRRIRA
ncbi:MAG: hypothetical protein ACJ757_09685 [Gaiellaceae bacterium]